MQGLKLAVINDAVKHTLLHRFKSKSLKCEIKVKVTQLYVAIAEKHTTLRDRNLNSPMSHSA